MMAKMLGGDECLGPGELVRWWSVVWLGHLKGGEAMCRVERGTRLHTLVDRKTADRVVPELHKHACGLVS